MKIYIPSYKRYNAVSGGTLKWIPKGLYKDVVMIVRQEEQDWYIKCLRWAIDHGLYVHPIESVTGIADTRRVIGLIAESMGEFNFCTMDDDVCFATRKSEEVTNLRPSEAVDMIDMLCELDRQTQSYAQVGISLRQGNNNVGFGPKPLLQENTRAIRVCAFQTMPFNRCEHGRVRVMEDIDVSLQLLSRGYKNAVLYHWAQDQKETNAPGGCSTWRTHEVHEEAAVKMSELWPGICTLRDKVNKTGGSFGSRKEITVQWKKAYRENNA